MKIYTEEELETIERLSALNYSIEEIAIYLNQDIEGFTIEANNRDSLVAYHLTRGKLVIKANSDAQILMAAERGSITAIQQLEKMRRNQFYYKILDQLDEHET